MNCIPFYFSANGVKRLHAFSPRSGALWSELAISLALDIASGGDGEYTYDDTLFWPRKGLKYRRLDWRVPTGEADEMYFRSGGPALDNVYYYHTRLPFFRVRNAQLKKMKIVIVTRSIFEIMESRFLKFASSDLRPDVMIDDEQSFDWDKYLNDAIEFFNSWGDVLTWHKNARHFRFEDLKANPVEAHKEILDFWGFDVPEDCVSRGLQLASKEEMKKHIPSFEHSTNERVSFRKKDQRGILPAHIKEKIAHRLKHELLYDLGHSISLDAKYGLEYA